MIAAAQAAGLFAAGLIVPVLGQMVSLFTPVPFILAAVRYGLREGLSSIALAMVLVTAVAGWQAGMILLVGFGLLSIALSWGMRKGIRPEYSIFLGGILPVAAAAVPLAYVVLQAGAGPVSAAEEYIRSSIQEAVKLYTSMGLTDLAAQVTGISDVFVHYFVRLLPGIVIATCLVQTACCYGIARFLILRRPGAGPDLPAQPSLASWHAPDAWVWGLIAALGCVAVPIEIVKFTGMNFTIIFLLVYTVQGMAVVDFLLRKGGLNAPVRGIIHAVVLALPSVMFLPPLGVVDIWADVRKVRTQGQTA
jgi:uncharacterized protein YybS (DUF2232 family)